MRRLVAILAVPLVSFLLVLNTNGLAAPISLIQTNHFCDDRSPNSIGLAGLAAE